MRLVAFIVLFIALSLNWADRAEAQSCMDGSVDDAALKAGELTTLLRIANFRGDLRYMSQVTGELEGFLATCGEDDGGRLPMVCGYDCHVQLARHRLFLASDLPFLSSASTIGRDGPISPQTAQARGNEGIQIVERGLKYLARQQAGGGDNEEASFRTYTRQLVSLNATKIRLYMSTGDTWYQTLSEAAIKALDFAITETIEVVPGQAVEDQPNLHKAHTQYTQAMWTLIETQTDIPDEQSYDDLRAELALLKSDLNSRLGSIARGHLYLNVDPYEFTTIPFEDLQARLQAAQARLNEVERDIEQIVREWSAASLSQDMRDKDQSRLVRSQKVNLLAHQIGKMEQEAQVFSNEVQGELNALGAEQDTFAFRQQIRTLELDLATRIAEFENRRDQILGRQELDLLVLEKEGQVAHRNELRWLLSFEMTQMNLDLQLSSLESQIREYRRQTERNNNQRGQLVLRLEILQSRIDNNIEAIAQADRQIEEILVRSGEIYRQSRLVQRESICNIEAQLAFVGDAPAAPFQPIDDEEPCVIPATTFTRQTYFDTMCVADGGLRSKLIDQQIRARAFVMKCAIGEASADFATLSEMVGSDQLLVEANGELDAELAAVDCGDFTDTEISLAQQLYEAEDDLLERQKEDLATQIAQLDEAIARVESWFGGFQTTVASLQTGLAAVEALAALLSKAPKITTAAAGMASGVYTEIDTSSPAKVAAQAMRNVLSTTLTFGQINFQQEQQVSSLVQALTKVRQANERIDLDKALKSLALHRTHFQLAGRRAQGRDDIKELVLQNSVAAIECSNQELGIAETVSRLQSEHRRQVAAMELNAQENDLARFQIAAQESQKERLARENDILALEIETIGLSDDQLASDTAQIETLIADVEGRRERVQQTQSTVVDLGEQSLHTTNIINELRERQRDKMLALSEDELAFVEGRIAGESAKTEELVASLDEAIGRGLKSAELQKSIREFQGETLQAVQEQQAEIESLVSDIDDPDETRALFIANQETLSDLLRGIPDYIDRKRRGLAVSNRLLHLLRQRHATVLASTGTVSTFPSTVVRNAAQLDQLVQDLENNLFFNENQVFISRSRVLIPENSGFAQRLALTGSVDFELNPFARTEAEMRDGGYFVLWNSGLMDDRQNMTLVDILLGAATTCQGNQANQYRLEHLGSGNVWRRAAEGSDDVLPDIVIGPPRSVLGTFYDFGANGETQAQSVVDFWLQNTFPVRNFPPRAGIPDNVNAFLPFLGAPAVSSYRLSLLPSDCGFEGASVIAYFIFSSAPP